MTAITHCASTDETHDFDHREIRRLTTEVEYLRGLVCAIHRSAPRLVMGEVRMDGHEYGALQRALDSGSGDES